jgi:flavin reductase (DIM6/NTAB) family NADH-FMN oxidoreductase RutF
MKIIGSGILFLLLHAMVWAQLQKPAPAAGFRKADIREVTDNPVKLIADDWALITAGDTISYNTMTASWGGIGNLWNMPVSFIFVKPQRYTFGFIEKSKTYTLCFFDHKQYSKALLVCGTKSGRDGDKIKEAGLTPVVLPSGMIGFAEARLIIECEVVYSDFLSPEGMELQETKDWYKEKDYHKMYAGKITGVWVR